MLLMMLVEEEMMMGTVMAEVKGDVGCGGAGAGVDGGGGGRAGGASVEGAVCVLVSPHKRFSLRGH